MSKFLEDIKYEVEVRLRAYNARRADLLNAQDEITKLDALIDEAQAELVEFKKRVPDKAGAVNEEPLTPRTP